MWGLNVKGGMKNWATHPRVSTQCSPDKVFQFYHLPVRQSTLHFECIRPLNEALDVRLPLLHVQVEIELLWVDPEVGRRRRAQQFEERTQRSPERETIPEANQG